MYTEVIFTSIFKPNVQLYMYAWKWKANAKFGNVYDRLSCVLNENETYQSFGQGNRRENSQIINYDIYILL
jgi:hypothetical protein